MTASEAYVHARQADGSTALVGHFEIHRPAGAKPFGAFAYVKSWRRNHSDAAFPLDPENLPLVVGPFQVQRRGLLPGALADATPDRWGRRLIQARWRAGAPPLSAADWLLSTGDDRVGCLAFSPTPDPPVAERSSADFADLDEIASGFERVLAGLAAEPLIERLYRAGRSLGGARPKASIVHDGALWIAKFQRLDDDCDQCAAEHATMRLAARAGIVVAETRLQPVGPRRALLVRRFDRAGAPDHHPTAHVLSTMSLLGLDETSDSGSYPGIARLLLRHARDHARDRRELFRRMVFNVLVGNRDDHLKNHALLYDEQGWRLSPAFDVTPQPGSEAMQAIGVGRFGSMATIANCLSLREDFGLLEREAQEIVAVVIDTVRGWRELFSDLGVDRTTIAAVGRVFAAEVERG